MGNECELYLALSAFWHVEVCLQESLPFSLSLSLSLSLSPSPFLSLSLSLSPSRSAFSFSSPLISAHNSRPSLILDTRTRVYVRAYRIMHTYALAQMNDISG